MSDKRVTDRGSTVTRFHQTRAITNTSITRAPSTHFRYKSILHSSLRYPCVQRSPRTSSCVKQRVDFNLGQHVRRRYRRDVIRLIRQSMNDGIRRNARAAVESRKGGGTNRIRRWADPLF